MAKDLPQLKEYLDNKNVQWFIYNILKNESDKTSDGKINTGGYNQNAGNSSAFGAGQFIGSTRNNILKEYNIDAWSPDLEEQKLAIVALLDNVGQLDEIKKGDFLSQYDPKKGQWEAFHNKEGILDNKPNKWETEYTTLSDTAVYRPDESWAKIPEDIKVEKLDLFENKYNGLPTEITNPIDNTLDPTAQALGLPTSEDVQTQLFVYNQLKDYDEKVAAGEAEPYLPNQNYTLDKPLADQYLELNSELSDYFSGNDNIPVSPTTSTASEGRSSGYENMTDSDMQSIYQMLLESDAAAKAAGESPNLVAQDFEEGPQAPQFLARRMQGNQEFLNDGIDKDEPFTVDDFNLGAVTDAETDAAYNRARQKEFIENPSGNYNNPDVRPEIEDSVDRNFLSKLKGQDYMGLLTDIGAYAARMAPLSRAMKEASSYDEERYPRFAPILPTATLPKRDVRDAFATAQQAALQQGKLDLGALSALATQQAKETARVEENVANERVGLLNQAQQINNQLTMQEMADTAANKGAAQTMQYQALAAMSEMGQGSLREANMRRNDQMVKQMFSNVFGDEFA